MALFLLSRHAAAFTPAARSLASKTSRANIRAFSATSKIANSWVNVRSSKLFMSTEAGESMTDIEAQIQAKGEEIRKLKVDGIEKDALAPHIEELVALKTKNTQEVEKQIQIKGDEIRDLKEKGVEKDALAPHIEELLALKAKISPPPEKPKKKKDPEQNQKVKKGPPKKEADMSDTELKQVRLAKVENMREAGAEPYAYSYDPTHTSMELQKLYEGKLEGGEEDEDSDVAVAGRIMAKRVFGKLAFFTLQDEEGTIQLHLEKNRLGDSFKVSIRNKRDDAETNTLGWRDRLEIHPDEPFQSLILSCYNFVFYH